MRIQGSQKQTGSFNAIGSSKLSTTLLQRLSIQQSKLSRRRSFLKNKNIQVGEQTLPLDIQSRFPLFAHSFSKLKGRVKI